MSENNVNQNVQQNSEFPGGQNQNPTTPTTMNPLPYASYLQSVIPVPTATVVSLGPYEPSTDAALTTPMSTGDIRDLLRSLPADQRTRILHLAGRNSRGPRPRANEVVSPQTQAQRNLRAEMNWVTQDVRSHIQVAYEYVTGTRTYGQYAGAILALGATPRAP
ncbi:hypothetical protein BJ508DRAFT_321692 [Ascobolus immersus RN42]|uniref:Uncharacterized protein n=1 Tax=Ascobolus immersus RN42 TaxID=1160509 RepID=A0A3N4IY18_ASCIM|nr:hypothetical protein BJ508DRAFT_321692 [Ascobolus immersus RN42]